MSRLTLLAAACGLFATGATSPVLAADPAPPAATSIQRLPAVQVDAARVRGVDDFDLPASFTVVAADDDNRRGAQVSELLDGIPGLVARDRQNYAQDTQLSIRGFGARSTFGVRGVRLLVDGIPASMPDGQGQLSHYNVLGAERVEVLRGPFSALYGNSSGGVLQLWSADGHPDDPWRLRATYGSNATVNVGAQLLGQQGAVHYNVAANRFDTDGFRAHSRAKRDSVNAKLGFDLAEGSRLDLVLNHLDAPDAQDPLGLTRAQFNADPAQATSVATQFNTRKSVRQSQAGAIFTQQLDNQTLRLMAYGGQRSVEQFLAIPVAVQRNPLHSGGVIDLDSNYDGADARWAWQGEALGRPLQLTVGANVDRQRQHRTGYENFVGDTLGIKGPLRRNQRDEVENVDQFAQLWWQWSDRWAALLGVRHSEVRFESDDHYIVGRNPDDSGRRDYSATTPVAGIVFRAEEDLRFYASVGRGFETPTFNELGYRSDGGAGLALDLGAATSRNYEVGSKWRAQSGAAVEFAVFRADTDDELAVASNTNGRSTYRNIGATRRQGAELSWQQPIGATQQLQLAYTFVDATVRDGYLTCASSGCATPTAAVASGSRLPGVPRQQLFARWQWQPAQWQFAAESVASGATVVNDLATERAPGYALVNLEASRRWSTTQGALRTFARVDNVLDRQYVGSVIVNDGNGRYYEPGPDRTYTVGLQWDFGG
ncbi:putative TonB-dependent receptor YncD [Xanthomonas citri pv. fuscans]|uniref:TonB-dependent receptor family protein n=1 Tax=Xanthomonas citri TaxID=346 RepID=UPI000C37C5A9|nr:TonB-dependent receptor [Xanthomonas citri]ATS49928.1 TonB-dependent receptor [Xanthomonas citri pv. phaseoli var. fuscans]ATS55661.1 TonB-dependent receptor [Xanthomonas citri pv. phaseoli var. fuscans]ATS60325.1 TonB-dependent receptor [Xanthomonas citri pv. phaseoli var. fuscans]SOO21643.1 putative TonB-dependent receptor YncD [Xanthomonas citri pv. fuscans]SOO34871.1 putative tonB-dependent receptor yncD [Xanthomonas citri pv. fuscans]